MPFTSKLGNQFTETKNLLAIRNFEQSMYDKSCVFMTNEQKSEFKVKGEELLKKVKELMKEGNVRRIIIKNSEGKTLIDIPVTLGVVGAMFLPIFAAVGAIAALAVDYTIEVIKKEE